MGWKKATKNFTTVGYIIKLALSAPKRGSRNYKTEEEIGSIEVLAVQEVVKKWSDHVVCICQANYTSTRPPGQGQNGTHTMIQHKHNLGVFD